MKLLKLRMVKSIPKQLIINLMQILKFINILFICLQTSICNSQTPDLIVPFTSDIGYPNSIDLSSGEYSVWYKTANGPTNQITKPFILIKGIDFFEIIPSLATTAEDIYLRMNKIENNFLQIILDRLVMT